MPMHSNMKAGVRDAWIVLPFEKDGPDEHYRTRMHLSGGAFALSNGRRKIIQTSQQSHYSLQAWPHSHASCIPQPGIVLTLGIRRTSCKVASIKYNSKSRKSPTWS